MCRKLIFVIAMMYAVSALAVSIEEQIALVSTKELNKVARLVAEAMSKETPMQIDSTTKLVSAVYVSSTNKFIYSYESTINLNTDKLKAWIINNTCTDNVRRAFMLRGLSIRHQYALPSGMRIASIDVTSRDCK